MTSLPPYPVWVVEPEWVLEPEQLGSKEKFWYRRSVEEHDWLFKHPQPETGQHWAEKIAAEVGSAVGVECARVELATFAGRRGSCTESFRAREQELFHGNQLLPGRFNEYDARKKFRQSSHTLANVLDTLAWVFEPGPARANQIAFASYLVLDALIGNTDRHHENWGLLLTKGPDWTGRLAPSFDHASSLGRELRDGTGGSCRGGILSAGRMRQYVERGRGGIFWNATDEHGPSPLELVRRGVERWPDLFRPVLGNLRSANEDALARAVARIPEDWMSAEARAFAVSLMRYSLSVLRTLL